MSLRPAGPFRRLAPVGALVASVVGLAAAVGQLPESPFLKVDAADLGLDRAGVWTMTFGYIPPRIAELDQKGKAEKLVVWYMPYYVVNKTGHAQTIYPEFELVTKDPDGPQGSFLDEPQPAVFDAITKKIEDTRNAYNYQTTIGISKTKIPEARPDTDDEGSSVHGIALWLDAPKAAPNNFSVYVSGLSNGRAVREEKDAATGKLVQVVSKKTLRLDFRRPTDNVRNKFDDIRVNDNNGLGGTQWAYRDSTRREKKGVADDAPPKAEK